MGVTDAPGWLIPAFVRSALAVGATAPRDTIEATAQRLLDRWREPGRRFHNMRHLVDVLARVDELAEECHHPDVVRLAAWYHGAVFSAAVDPALRRPPGEDEVASAEIAREELAALGVPDKQAERVHELVLNLRRHDADPDNPDAVALCDAELGTLAAEPQRYAEYRKAVRAEYDHVPPRDYVEARIRVITRLLDRSALFRSPMATGWEGPARQNLTAELDRLQAELAALGPRADGEAATAPVSSATIPPEAATGAPVIAAPPEPAPPEHIAAPPAQSAARPEQGVRTSAESPASSSSADAGARPPAKDSDSATLSSLEAFPDELDPLRHPRPVTYSDPERARRAEHRRIAQEGRERMERVIEERRRRREAEIAGGNPTDASAPSPAEPSAARDGADRAAAEAEDAGRAAHDESGRTGDAAGTPDPGPAALSGMERDPDLIAWRSRKRRTAAGGRRGSREP